MDCLILWFWFSCRVHREHRRWEERRVQRGWAQTDHGPCRQLLILFWYTQSKQASFFTLSPVETCLLKLLHVNTCTVDWNTLRSQSSSLSLVPWCWTPQGNYRHYLDVNSLLIPPLPWLVCLGFPCNFLFFLIKHMVIKSWLHVCFCLINIPV